MAKNVDALIKQLEAEGYKVQKAPSAYTLHSFQIDKGVLARFFEVQRERGLKVREAIDEALRDWIKRRG